MNLALTEPTHARAGANLVRARNELRAALAAPRRECASIGLVPTMGGLHEGHLSLLRAARAECHVVVMSLFVNPAQFGPGEDLERYPRDEQRDLALAAEAGVDLVYAPPVEEVYPPGFSTQVEVEGLTEVLCGDPSRRGPGHFHGVTTVVAKLFNAVGPDVAYFGQKDAQQVAAIRRMVRDLDIPLRIEALPIVREPDGLAMSSRNAYLEPPERERATALWRALALAERVAREGSLSAALEAARGELAAAGVEPEYLEARDPDELTPVAELGDGPVLIAVAATVSGARLIDNVLVDPDHFPDNGNPGRVRIQRRVPTLDASSPSTEAGN
ncbi:MAG: pantoate--beta-alanine ligase [Solirubrobacterales bacterium]